MGFAVGSAANACRAATKAIAQSTRSGVACLLLESDHAPESIYIGLAACASLMIPLPLLRLQIPIIREHRVDCVQIAGTDQSAQMTYRVVIHRDLRSAFHHGGPRKYRATRPQVVLEMLRSGLCFCRKALGPSWARTGLATPAS